MAIVTVYDTEGQPHQKESIDASECVRELGWTLTLAQVSEGASRDDMKAFLSAAGVEFAANIKGAALVELYNAEKAKG